MMKTPSANLQMLLPDSAGVLVSRSGNEVRLNVTDGEGDQAIITLSPEQALSVADGLIMAAQ